MISHPVPNGFLYKEHLVNILTSDKQKLFFIIDNKMVLVHLRKKPENYEK